MATKKIINPRNNKAYAIRQKTTKHGKKGQIKSLYKTKKEAASYVSKNFGDVIKKLSNQ